MRYRLWAEAVRGAWCADRVTVSERGSAHRPCRPAGASGWHVRPAGWVGFTHPRPDVTTWIRSTDQAAAGLDHPAATAALFRLPGGDRDCGVHPLASTRSVSSRIVMAACWVSVLYTSGRLPAANSAWRYDSRRSQSGST
jgi:hypothetical protein